MEYNDYGANLYGWYNAPLFDSRTGRATSALSSLKDFAPDDAAVKDIKVDAVSADNSYYNLQGMRVTNPVSGQVYIHNGKKILY